MVEHLTKLSMSEFTRDIVLDSRWGPQEVEVRLNCLPGPTLRLNVRQFVPSRHLFAIQTCSGSGAINVDLVDSLPIGIYNVNPEYLAATFSIYLENMIDNHLIEYSSNLLEVHRCSQSSQALTILFSWFQACRNQVRGLIQLS